MVTILDGALGTELLARGVALPDGAWSAHALRAAPDVVASIHRAYAAAGATEHTACTFRTQPRVMGAWREALEQAVALCRQSVPGACAVWGSVAPLEDCYRPDLSPPAAEARAAFRAFAAAARDAHVDGLLCETFASVPEALLATEACAEHARVWTSLTAGPDGALLAPFALRDAARSLAAAGAEIVLVNCVAAERIAPYVDALAQSGVAFGVYANAFGADAVTVEQYMEYARDWVSAGARVVGGCCGTTPAHIAALAAAFGERRSESG